MIILIMICIRIYLILLLYDSGACGYNNLKKYDQIKHRTMRFFLGAHQYAHKFGVQDLDSLLLIDMYIW